MRVIVFTLLWVLCTAAFAATVYKWVDENGVTHYSDQPHENAEKVTLAQPQTYKAPKTPAQPPPTATGPKSTAPVYSNCAIVQPADEDTFPNATSVTTAVVTTPVVRDGDQVFLLLDGAKVPNFPTGGGSFTISPIDRGSHSLQAIVQDSGGQVVCQSPNITFTVLQPSILNPANPNFHR
jgi:Domain of unknown function (DUF4124)